MRRCRKIKKSTRALPTGQNVYRNRKQPLNVRVRCAVEALVHEYPRVSAVAVTSMSGQSFAEALERAIQRSKSPLALNAPASTIEHDPAQDEAAALNADIEGEL